jgi:hypothetical protein
MAVQLMDRSAVPRMPAFSQSAYDPTRIGQPEYMRRLEREAFAAEDEWERPWSRHHTSGMDSYDPFNVR